MSNASLSSDLIHQYTSVLLILLAGTRDFVRDKLNHIINVILTSTVKFYFLFNL